MVLLVQQNIGGKYMDFKTADEVINKAYNLEDEGKYVEALELWETGFNVFSEEDLKEYQYDIFVGKIWTNSLLKRSEEFISNIIEAVGKGFICPKWMFEYKNNGDYETFLKHWQRDARYENIREKNELLRTQKEKRIKLEYKVFFPNGYSEKEKYPIFIAMHGDGDNMELLMKEWKAETFLSRGYIVVYVQSAQVSDQNGYSWINDFSITRRDIRYFYEEIREKYLINEECVILGGFSGGAIGGVDILMEDIIPIRGLIAICPERKPESVTIENVKKAMFRKAKIIFMEGEKNIPMREEEEMLSMFKEVGLPCEYYINKGLEHEIPKDLNEKLDKVLAFIFNQNL